MERFVGLLGLITILGIAYALSTNRKAISFRTVGWGLGLQFALALFVLKTRTGIIVFQWLGGLVTKLLEFTKEGSGFVFGPLVTNTAPDGSALNLGFIFAFQVLPAIIFVGSLAGIAYYIGLMQFVVNLVARLMVKTMGTSGAESLYAVATVFVGQSEAPLLVRPYLEKMTRSELNAIMTGGMATIAGSVLFAYVGMLGEQWAPHLLAASIMGAPAGLALAKILYPETEVPATAGVVKLESAKKEGSIIEAASKGAADGMHLAFLVGTMLIAFIALIATINGLLGWLGGFFGYGSLSLQLILGWIFSPLAWLIGVPWAEAGTIGSLVGQKLVLNEFVAYSELTKLIPPLSGTTALLSDKAIVIATFALCGFANFSSIGINIGCIGGLAPSRQADLAQLGFRAMLGGALASCMTASLAGILL
ncbi:MAG: NupC/NupG family nucleoside CNT transporter [Candidatus Xenobium sp.]|jgi:CNT family concentrative nucleoside transporter|nr:NupC/NupG family nucleoside CNT transporter [Burkholderiales bacterium]